MAILNPDLGAIGRTVTTTAAARAVRAVTQSMSPRLVRDVQRVVSTSSLVGNILGARTGITALDTVLGLGGGRDAPTPMLGGLSLRQAEALFDQMQSLRAARKNLFFIRVQDPNPPRAYYKSRSPVGSLIESRIGPVLERAASAVQGGPSGVSRGGGGVLVADVAAGAFDMLAMDVSYGDSIAWDHTQVGSSFVAKPTGVSPMEMQITTLDDEAGTLKTWLSEKRRQVAHEDGTFGLPVEYLVTIEVVHAIPSDQVEGYALAYHRALRMQFMSVQHELSRREQALEEIQLTLSQFDPFMGV